MTGPLEKREHEKFCHLVAQGMKAATAYRAAGYKGTPATMSANATRLLRNDSIRARIAELSAPVFDQYEVTTGRIQREMAMLAFSRRKDYKAFLASGDLDDVTSEESASISEVTVERIHMPGARKSGRRKKGDAEAEPEPEVIRTKVKWADKHGPLVSLARIAGLMKDSVDITVPVTFMVEWTAPAPKEMGK